MEDNDIGTFADERYNVVVLEPTLVYRDSERKRRRLRQPSITQQVEEYRISELMGRWIHQQGYSYGIRTSLWGFGSTELFYALTERVDRLYGRYIFRYECFSAERDALAALMADGSINAVYDGDEDRVERLWKLRGHRVQQGKAP
jgi:hypothetical protein